MPAGADRCGSLAWTRSTRGRLSSRERRRLLLAIVGSQAEYIAGRIRLATGRVPDRGPFNFDQLEPPDSGLAKEAEAACAEQGPGLIGHSYRTWAFGSALAAVDGIALDPELFYVACLVHDHGIDPAVPGEDFTLRSAARAAACAESAGRPTAVAETVAGAITTHTTPGITVAEDGPLGVYVQSGAVFDLAGVRCGDLPRSLRADVHAAHPRAGVDQEIKGLIKGEARAVPDGRFALLNRCGFSVLVGLNPIAREANSA